MRGEFASWVATDYSDDWAADGRCRGLAKTYGIDGRVEIMDAVQFLGADLYGLNLLQAVDQRSTGFKLVENTMKSSLRAIEGQVSQTYISALKK